MSDWNTVGDDSDTDELLAASRAMGGDDRANVYFDALCEQWVYRASALGNCLRSLILDRRGFVQSEPPDTIKKAWAGGNQFEPIIIQRFREEFGFTVVDDVSLSQYGEIQWNGQVETEMQFGSKIVRCHPDSIMQCFSTTEELRRKGLEVGDRYVVEVKKFGPDFYAKYKREGLAGFPYYLWQFAVEMLSTGLPGVFVVGVLNDAKDDIAFIDPKFFSLDQVPKTKMDILKRLMKIEKGAEQADNGEGMPDNDECEWAQWPCGHWQTHTETGVWLPKRSATGDDDKGDEKFRGEIPTVSPEDEGFENSVQQLVYKLNLKQTLAKEYDAEAKQLKEQLRIRLIGEEGGKRGEYWGVGKYTVEVRGRAGKMKAKKGEEKVVGELKAEMEEHMEREPDTLWVEVKERKGGE